MKCDGSTACESELRTELKNLTLKYRCSSLVVVIFIWAMVPLYEWGRGFMQIESFSHERQQRQHTTRRSRCPYTAGTTHDQILIRCACVDIY